MPRNSRHDARQKADLVLQLLRKEAPASQIARAGGISEPTLYRWRDEFMEGGLNGLSSGNSQDLERERRRHESELAERDRVIGELTVANRVLKKLSGN